MVGTSAQNDTTTAAAESIDLSDELATKRKKLLLLFVLLYIIGIVWTLLHPVVSIITGEKKCRGSYIDENALDPNYFSVDALYPTYQDNKSRTTSASTLCEALLVRDGTTAIVHDNVSCFHHGQGGFDVARVVPLSSAVDATSEIIVVVVPAPSSTWMSSELHVPVLHMLQRLSDPQKCSWLAKTVLLVSPTTTNMALETTISAFLEAYSGAAHSVGSPLPPLPPSYSGGMIRNLLVVDVTIEEEEESMTELRILTQGPHGALPNMDYVFAITAVYRQRATYTVMHPYGSLSRKMVGLVELYAPAVRGWAKDLSNMLLFAYTLAMGPYAPHAPALAHGIDAVTIEGVFHGQSKSKSSADVADMVRQVEHLIRGISNLHERLHHSITQYLLPSPSKFVAHTEYLIPNILLLLPLVGRVLFLLLVDIQRFRFRVAGQALLAVSVAIPLLLISHHVQVSVMDTLYTLSYTLVYVATLRDKRDTDKQGDERKTVLLVACLLSLYLHVPLTFAHSSLSYPSALLWTPLLAFQSCHGQLRKKAPRKLKAAFLFATWPSFRLVPSLFKVYTPYVVVVYTPLHILLCVLWLA